MPFVPTTAEFRAIRDFILRQGDRRTYCNMYNRNPHYSFDGFEAYLNPDVGQRNINCEPELSGFDQLVIQDWSTSTIYFSARESGGALICEPGIEVYFERMSQRMNGC
jgi:hypothetical protein